MGANRLDRVRELLKRELGEIIRQQIPVDRAGIVTVNHVDITPDLHSAAVYVSTIGTHKQRSEALSLLKRRAKMIQGTLARSIVLKHSPKLKFFTDESIEKGDNVLKILDELEKESQDTDFDEDEESGSSSTI